MARFSERYGYRDVRAALQQEDMDEHLRVDLWNALSLLAEDIAERYTRGYAPYLDIWIHLWRKPVDQIPYTPRDMSAVIKDRVLSGEWYDVYDLIESYVQSHAPERRATKVQIFNHILERNLSAYRLVDGVIARIDEDSDVEAIEQALLDTSDITGGKHHLQQALRLLADRAAPDYPNSVKESVSAVEAVCQHLSGQPKASLSDGLRALKTRGVVIHPALERSWQAAYGYSSDADGIRHALSEEPSVDQARARYFLVACSAFVSLLINEGAAVGLVGKD